MGYRRADTAETYSHTHTDHLILVVISGLEAVLFHREIMSSFGRTDTTAPHNSSPTMNCSPRIARSCMAHNVNSQFKGSQ